MKILLFIFVLFGFLFIGQEDVFAQKKSKKIETWQLYHTNSAFFYCTSNGYPEPTCVEKATLTFSNNSESHVSKLTVKLIIADSDGRTIYKRKHTIQVDLDPGEEGTSKQFKLYEKLVNNDGFEETSWNVEIISIN